MPLDALEATLEPLLLAWRQSGMRRGFGDYVVSSGRDEVQRLLAVA